MANDFILSPQEKQVIEPLMRYLTPHATQSVKEVVINRPGRIGYEFYDGHWEFQDVPELDQMRLTEIMRLLADRNKVNYENSNPILSLKMPGGHRAQIVGGDQTTSKFTMAIRLESERDFGLDDYHLSEEDKAEIINAVTQKKTLLISGGTGSGKTHFMNVLLGLIPEEERLVTLEDVRELKINRENACSFLFSNAGPNVLELLNATLRMRPDRILLGEIRKENAFAFCNAINTGHAGSIATIHANSPSSAINAVISRVLLNGDISESAINIMRQQLNEDIYGVVQLERIKDGVKAYFKPLSEISL